MKKLILLIMLCCMTLPVVAEGKKVRYQGALTGGVAIQTEGRSPEKWYEITTRHGVRLFDYLFIGTGFSYIAAIGTPIDREIPVFGTVTGYLPLGRGNISLYASCDLGYACIFREGYYKPSVGVDISTSRRTGITFDIGYRHLGIGGDPFDLTTSYVSFAVGFRF